MHMFHRFWRRDTHRVFQLSVLFLISTLLCVGWPSSSLAIGGSDDSITILSSVLTLENDADDNGIANIGDTIRVTVTLNNTDGGCSFASTTVAAGMAQYGGDPAENVPCTTDNEGIADEFVLDFIIGDAGSIDGIDVAALDEDTAVEVEASDSFEDGGVGNPDPTSLTNTLGNPVDSIAPSFAATDAYFADSGSGIDGIFVNGDEVNLLFDNSEFGAAIPDLVQVIADMSGFGGSSETDMTPEGSGCSPDMLDIFQACVWIVPEIEIDDVLISPSVTAVDDAGNIYQEWTDEAIDVDNVAPQLAEINPLTFLKQDGGDTAVPTRFWYFYEGTEIPDVLNLRVSTEAEADGIWLNDVRVCTKSITTDDQGMTGLCSLEDFEDEFGPWISVGSVDETTHEQSTDMPAWPLGPGGYSMNVLLIDHAGNYTLVTDEESVFVALFGIDPMEFDPSLDNDVTTDWETILDFTAVTDLTFSEQEDLGGEIGIVEWARMTFAGPLNLTDQDTITGLVNFALNVELDQDLIDLDSDALVALDTDAELIMHMDAGGQPGLIVSDNDGSLVGYVDNDAVEDVDVGADTLGGFSFNEITGDFTFTTTGFTKFVTDNDAPVLESSAPADGGTMNKTAAIVLNWDEPVNVDTFLINDSVLGTESYSYSWNGDQTRVSITHDPWNAGDVVTLTFSVEDKVGNLLEDEITFTARTASSSSSGPSTAPSTTPTVSWNTPSGGEVWTSGKTQVLSWDIGGSGIQTVKFEYSTNGTAWTLIQDNVTASLGNLSWTIPAISSSSVRVRASAQDSGKAVLASATSNLFTVSVPEEAQEPTDTEQEARDAADALAGIARDAENRRIAPLSDVTGFSPFDGSEQKISIVQPGWFIRGYNYDTVYYVSSDMTRRAFWDANTFMTWAESWDEVVWVTDTTLASLPLGQPMLMQPQTIMVKITSDPRVYWVEEGTLTAEPYVLRWVTSETVASTMFGAQWMDSIIDVEPTLFGRYAVGTDITSPETIDVSRLLTRQEIIDRVAGN